MINNLQNKTAIITGASNGIGMEIGKKFLQAFHHPRIMFGSPKKLLWAGRGHLNDSWSRISNPQKSLN